jgi:uncharacterized integral membrane protein
VKHLVVTFAEIIIVVALAIFAVGNIRSASYHFAGTTFTGNVWWIAVGSALLGFLFAVLLLGPGHSVAGLRGRSLRRQHEQTAEDLMALRREHERLRRQYAQTTVERDEYRSRVASATPAGQMTAPADQMATPAGVAPTGDGAGAVTDEAAQSERSATTTEQVATDTQEDQPATTTSASGWPNPFRVQRAEREPDDTQMPTGAAPTA